ncbi:hypothetical protein FOZ61_006720 [Perkinsus olseni]|uniref:Cytochrome P450 n=1 Tax=Perkinsus olseni TaxID=32597 RepID=A0A7J6LCL4_PEROL|nr:hypothetical protein FOZ61_006720 [Perkinsus olseni]
MTRDKFPWNLNPMTRKVPSIPVALPKTGAYISDYRFLIAGSDTTAIAVSWCLYYLSLNPHIQTEASAEVGGLGRDPKTRADLNDLAYVECCLLETLRLQPPGRFLFHECISDSLLVGKPIPSSTIVGALLRGAMVAECGTSFKPERWLIPGSSEIDRVLVRDHLAFGGGPRQCPGQNMAIKDATMVLALILQYFDDIKLNHSPESVRVLALKARRFLRRTKVDLHAIFGGPNHFLPILGFIPKSMDHFARALEIYADTYGDVYHIKITGMNVIVLSKPELVRQVLDERPKTFIRPFNKHKIIPLSGMFTTEGDAWKRNRRFGAPAFNDKNSAAMVPDMLRVSLKLVRQLKSLSQDGRIVWRPTEWLPLCTLDVLCVTTLGNDYNFLNPDGLRLGSRSGKVQRAIVDTLSGSGYAVQLSSFPWMTRDRFPWNLNPMIRKMHTGVKRLNRICDEIISSRRAERQAARGGRVERRNLLDKLLHLDPEDLRGNLVTFLIAGSDTTAMAVSWCLYYLSFNPHIQAKARAEVDALGHDPKTIADLNQLPYVECCILETLRLQSPSVFLLNECVDDTLLDGKPVPAGTVVAVLQHQWLVALTAFEYDFLGYAVNLRPERWFTNDGVSIDQSLNMAIKEATMIMALILRFFDDIRLNHSPSCVRVLALKVLLKLVQRAKVDLHALFGGPNRFLPILGFVPKSLDHLCHALEIYADTYGTSEYSRGASMVASFLLRVTRMDVGEEWKRNRRLGAPAFNDNNSDAMVPDMSDVALKLVRQLKSLSQTGRIVWRPTEWLPLCTLDVLCVTTLGNDYNFLNPDSISLGYRYNEVQQAIADAMAGAGYVAQLSAFPWMTRDRFPWKFQGNLSRVPGWNLNLMIKKLHTGVRRLNSLCDEIIGARRAEQQAGRRVERRDLLDKLLHLDEEDLRGNLITFLIAGSDTTAMAVSWCLYYLSFNPHIQAKARAEVDALGHDPKTIADLNRLAYVECCILETLRLQPPGVVLLHECVRDTFLVGKPIPPGTVVITLQRKAMMAHSQGGTTFKPERWFIPDSSEIDQGRVRDHLAFGGGPRQCPGQNMAIKEAMTIITLILRHFDDVKNSHSPANVRGEVTFTYGPKDFELQMFERAR